MVWGFGAYLRSLQSGALLNKVNEVTGVGLGQYWILLGATRNLYRETLDPCLNAVYLGFSVTRIHSQIHRV